MIYFILFMTDNNNARLGLDNSECIVCQINSDAFI